MDGGPRPQRGPLRCSPIVLYSLLYAVGDVSRRVILKPEHFPAFVEMCERHDMGALWMLALCTARRECELLGLRWTDVAWERSEVRVERQLKRLHGSWYLEAIKTGERGESTIRLPEVAVDVLRRHHARQNDARLAAEPTWSDDWPQLIFTVMDTEQRRGTGRRPSGRPGDPLQPTAISKGFPTAVVEAGLPRLRFHDYADLRVMPTGDVLELDWRRRSRHNLGRLAYGEPVVRLVSTTRTGVTEVGQANSHSLDERSVWSKTTRPPGDGRSRSADADYADRLALSELDRNARSA